MLAGGDIWYTIEGTVVGWLSGDDTGEVAASDVMVVTADKYNNGEWGKCSKPSFVLRWIGNDFTIIDGVDGLNVEVGDIVRFATCDREQEMYADQRPATK